MLKDIIQLLTISVLRYFIISGVAFFLFYWLGEHWFAPNKIQGNKAGRKDFIREILHSMQTTVVLTIIGCVIMFTPLKKFTLIYDGLHDRSMVWFFCSLVIAFLIHDTYFYWMHRLLHHPRLFKLTHLLHHRSNNPSPWAAYSFSFIEAWTEGLVLLLIVLVLPIHLYAIMAFVLGGFVINVYGHLGYEVAPLWLRGSILFEIVNTSVHHNVHHSKFKGNYGLYLRIWDRLMGTEHPDYVAIYDRVQQKRMASTSAKKLSSFKALWSDRSI
ncbi:sterol desaturase family protein [Mucilaginibacter daejeonensis]|uniref:sterol desaturase family protein n=1 Tax=Mucilaginibacter daejeonensis TaxID=398049 RepID=UPI001D1755BF|nr:sterol desaturase family protein [Mucilaginibacter daejeonensis]UEG53361.1 sterol desaturase family protein [Mucilaginibacter daejeonensis]